MVLRLTNMDRPAAALPPRRLKMAKTATPARRGSFDIDTRVLRSNLDISSISFNWSSGRFEQPPGSLPLAIKLFFHLGAAAMLMAGCASLLLLGLVEKKYALLDPNATNLKDGTYPYLPLELIRFGIFVGAGYLGYVLANYATRCSVKMAGIACALRRKEAPLQLRRIFDAIVWLNPYICRFVGSVSLLAAAYLLYPLSEEELKENMWSLRNLNESTQVDPNKMVEAMNNLLNAGISSFITWNRSPHFIMNRLVLTLVIFLGAILLEKIILRNIAMTFYLRSFGKRIEDNTFVLKTTRTLRHLVLASREDLKDKDTATVIFEGVRSEGKHYITSSDIATLIPGITADRYFELLDVGGEMRMSQELFAHALRLQHQESTVLRKGLQQQAGIVNKLDRLLCLVCYVAVALASLVLFQVPVKGLLAALGGITAIILFLSTGTLKTAVESVLFVIFTHPFDVGDQVMVGGEPYSVKELGLWTTTFETPGGHTTYIANSRLRTEMIHNTRRSPYQNEWITFNVLPSVSNEKLKELEAKMQEFVRAHPKDYLPKLSLSGYVIVDQGTMKMRFQLFHRGNFQDGALKGRRTRNFYLALKEALDECGVALSNPPPVLAHGA